MKAEERKELKDKLKKQIDELSDEELDQVAGGTTRPECQCPVCGGEWVAWSTFFGFKYCHECGYTPKCPKCQSTNNIATNLGVVKICFDCGYIIGKN